MFKKVGRAIILETLGLSQLVYSASNLLVPQGIADAIKNQIGVESV